MVRLAERYILLSPAIKVFIEWPLLLGSGVISLVFRILLLPFYPVFTIVGGVLIVSSMVFHRYCELYLSRKRRASIAGKETLVTTGIYARIRHPIYLCLILFYWGIGLAFAGLLPLFVAALLAFLTILMTTKEERLLAARFPTEYAAYCRNTPYRMLPGIY